MTTLDQLVAKSMQLAGAGVLFMARRPIHYQKGLGIGRRQFQECVLLIHPKDSDHVGTWILPDMDVAGDAHGTPLPFGDVLLARVDSQFVPAPSPQYDDHCWTIPEFAVECAANHPSTTAVLQQFLATQSDLTGDFMDSRKDFQNAQAKADPVFRARGDEAPPPMQGESALGYRQRLAGHFQKHHKQFANTDLSKIGCPNAFCAIEDQIFGAAMTALDSGSDVPAGKMRAVVKNDGGGRPITKYVASDDGACWDQFNPPIRHVRRINA